MLTLLALVDKFGIPTFVSSAALIVALPSPSVRRKFMNSRVVISALCVGVVAYACGPQTRNEASAPVKSAALAASSGEIAIQQQGRARRARLKDSALDAQLVVRAEESTLRFALHVVNTSKKRIEVTFPSGQTHDFVVLDTAGREVWRWGTGRMFTQTLRNKLLGAGDSMQLEESLKSAKLAPGRYIARGTLASDNYPLAQEAEFTIAPHTVASR